MAAKKKPADARHVARSWADAPESLAKQCPVVGAGIILGLPGLEHHLVGVRENPAQRVARASWHSLSHDGLHAEPRVSIPRKPARFAALEPIYDSHSHPSGRVIADAIFGCPAEKGTRAPQVDGSSLVERPSYGLGFKIPAGPGVLVVKPKTLVCWRLNCNSFCAAEAQIEQ